MSNFNWCHGPKCHERKTTTRIRGVKGFKVLRTRKIPYNSHYENYYKPYKYFCDQTCMHDFIIKHIEEFVRLHPRPEALETPIDVVVETKIDWNGNSYKTKEINVVDNA